jgi:hypothetical protein
MVIFRYRSDSKLLKSTLHVASLEVRQSNFGARDGCFLRLDFNFIISSHLQRTSPLFGPEPAGDAETVT